MDDVEGEPASACGSGLSRFGRAPGRHLAAAWAGRHPGVTDEEQGIYRAEVSTIMIALTDIMVDVRTMLGHIEGDDDEAQEEGLPDA